MTWISTKEEHHKLEEEVLCITRKFGFAQNRTETDTHEVLWWNGKTWEDWERDDIEDNPDYIRVVYWMEIPELKE